VKLGKSIRLDMSIHGQPKIGLDVKYTVYYGQNEEIHLTFKDERNSAGKFNLKSRIDAKLISFILKCQDLLI
jgi:hypothetical protein